MSESYIIPDVKVLWPDGSTSLRPWSLLRGLTRVIDAHVVRPLALTCDVQLSRIPDRRLQRLLQKQLLQYGVLVPLQIVKPTATQPLDECVVDILRDWMLTTMSDISEEHYCAQWLTDLEYTLWRAVLQYPEPYDWGGQQIAPLRIERLKRVAELIGEWGQWGDHETTGHPTTIPLAQWQERFANAR